MPNIKCCFSFKLPAVVTKLYSHLPAVKLSMIKIKNELFKAKAFQMLLLSLLLAVVLTSQATTFDHHLHQIPSFLHLKPSGRDINAEINSMTEGLGPQLVESMGSNRYTLPHEANAEFWLNLAREEVTQRTKQKPMNLNKAKNIIMFLGDGMSLSTVTAARIRKGQLKGNTGEEDSLSFEKFPYVGLSKTYCVNAQGPDSACTATAYLCGVKGNIATIGVNAQVNFNNCTESENSANHVSSIAAWAQKAGKSTGIITTVTLTDASPAGSYAHTANREWECDADIPNSGDHNDLSQCKDIAQQLMTQEPGRSFDLVMGGGMGKFLPKHLQDLHGNVGQRLDGQNLLATWQGMHPSGVLVHNRNNLLSLNISKVSHILGLFQSGYLDYHAVSDKQKQPTLSEMTKVGINFLSEKSDKGFFLFIEGAQIDTANHDNLAAISLDETLEMDKAIQKARDMTDPNETLIVVTADHSHPLTIAGYPQRGNNILGFNQHDTDINGIRYSTLNYAAGSKQYLDDRGKRLDIANEFGENLLMQYPSYIHINGGVHGGDDVGVYASGPHDHIFRGVMQQHTIPHMMAYAACIGEGPTVCDNEASEL